MAIADKLLVRLQGVRKSSANSWVAKCPAHADRSPSLTVRELQDGRVLLHCFAGCEALDVLGAVGLEFGDLFPEPLERPMGLRRVHAPFSAHDALTCVKLEAALVSIAASDVVDSKPLAPADAARIALAAGRIATALEVINA